jgi:hypothetical protein
VPREKQRNALGKLGGRRDVSSNPYVNFFTANNEQNLVENLVVESLKFYSHDVIYVPRTPVNHDNVFNEPDYSAFTSTANVEVYIQNFESFQGDGNFLSKFGLEIRDKMTFQMSKRSFTDFVAPVSTRGRPYEGDLIYVPMTRACYQVNFVETDEVFYQLGRLYSYQLKCELFEYSNEVFNTGVAAIDSIAVKYDTNADIDNDAFNENEPIQEAANNVLDWSVDTPFGEF